MYGDDLLTDKGLERMTAEAAAQAEAMLAALDLEQLQRDTLEAIAQMERVLDDTQTGADAISGAAAQAEGGA